MKLYNQLQFTLCIIPNLRQQAYGLREHGRGTGAAHTVDP